MRVRVAVVVAFVIAAVAVPVVPATAAGPTAPAPVAPVGNASVTQPALLQWGTSQGTTPIVAYNWQVASNATFTALVLTGSTAASSAGGAIPRQASISGLANGSYFWRVNAVQDASDPNV